MIYNVIDMLHLCLQRYRWSWSSSSAIWLRPHRSGQAADLADVDGWTGFNDRFTHLRTGQPAADKATLLAAVLADGPNLGLLRMADVTRGLTYHHLVNVAQWHVSDDNYVAARAAIINAH